jgi:hypothetical protein
MGLLRHHFPSESFDARSSEISNSEPDGSDDEGGDAEHSQPDRVKEKGELPAERVTREPEERPVQSARKPM